jgi:hypothetical protein
VTHGPFMERQPELDASLTQREQNLERFVSLLLRRGVSQFYVP